MPTIVLDRPGWLSVKRRMNSCRLIPSSSSSSSAASQRSGPEASPPLERPHAPVLVLGRGAAGGATADQDARAALARPPRSAASCRAEAPSRGSGRRRRRPSRCGRRGSAGSRTCRGSGPCPRRAARPSPRSCRRSPAPRAVGDMCTWTRSRWSVCSRRRLCSTPARTLAARVVVRVGRRRVGRRVRAGSRTWRPGSTRRAGRSGNARSTPRCGRSRSRCRSG